MPVAIYLPQVGESVIEGVIGKWLKQVGDTIEKYDPLVEVVTDKVNMEFPSPYNGTLAAILAREGDIIPMGAPIAEMETDEAEEETDAASTTSPKQERSIGRTGMLLKDTKPVGPTGSGEQPPLPDDMANPQAATPTSIPKSYPPKETAPSIQRHSPVVRRLAAEHGINLAQVAGTGMDGRITKEDVQRYVEQTSTAPTTAASMAQPAAPDEEAIPLTPIRRIIAENMIKSASQIPQAWVSQEVDVSNLVALRENTKEEFQQREGVPLTYLPFVIKAVVESLKEHPRLNSAWGGDKVIIKKRVNIGLAVATPQGLFVPVVHDADAISIAGLARASNDVIQRARDGKLNLWDVQGGTFTVNNTGTLGSVVSQPLVYPPQAAILTTEAIVKRPVVLPGDAIAVRSMMNVCMSFDHRILDGSDVGAFMLGVKQRLEATGQDTPIY